MRLGLFFGLCLYTSNIFAAAQGPVVADPGFYTDYKEAFEIKTLTDQAEFKDLFLRGGSVLYQNLYEETDTDRATPRGELDIDDFFEEYNSFHTKAQAHFNRYRRFSILRPARDSLTQIGFLGGAGTLFLTALGPSYAAYGLTWAIMDSAASLRNICNSFFNVCFTPRHALDEFELDYIHNKPFIPKQLWPSMERAFTKGRQNPFDLDHSINFLSFSTGLTLYKPAPKLHLSLGESAAKRALYKDIDNFFEGYEYNPETIGPLKQNIWVYMQTLLDPEYSAITPKPVFLQGIGGIGKTHFIKKLGKMINSYIGNALQVVETTIQSTDDLEGSTHNPGVLFKILKDQLSLEKQGSLVIIDDPTVDLNDPAVTNVLKRVYNGTLTEMHSKYFEERDFSIPIKSFLTFFGSNIPLEDNALKSRFLNIDFPTPKKGTLSKFGLKQLSKALKRELSAVEKERCKEIIEAETSTFREVNGLLLRFNYEIEEIERRETSSRALGFSSSLPERLEEISLEEK